MTFAWPDRHLDKATRLARLDDGEVLVYPASTPSLTLVSYARSMISAAFGRLDPELAQFVLSDDEFTDIVTDLEPVFIDHPDSVALIRDALRFSDCDLETVCFDAPRIRTSASGNLLTPGVASVRPPQTVADPSPISGLTNCVIPIFPVSDRGAVMFSGGELHSGNDSGRTRFSIDFRTFDRAEVAEAHDVDAEVRARGFLRAIDLRPVGDDEAARHDPLHREEHET